MEHTWKEKAPVTKVMGPNQLSLKRFVEVCLMFDQVDESRIYPLLKACRFLTVLQTLNIVCKAQKHTCKHAYVASDSSEVSAA